MYHDITPAVTPRRGSEWFAVAAESFARQLDLIRGSGFAGCSIARALEQPGRRVAISFDDGRRSDYERAFSALAERGMTATFFVVTDLVGTTGHVTWPELREMQRAGMSIQSHTRTHPFLSELSGRALRDELAGSKARLDDALGQDTDQLALPGGDAPRRSMRGAIVEAGYRVAATSRWGMNGAQTLMGLRYVRRCTVAGNPADAHFRRVIEGDRSVALHRIVREQALGALRRALGPSRYAAWRRAFLNWGV